MTASQARLTHDPAESLPVRDAVNVQLVTTAAPALPGRMRFDARTWRVYAEADERWIVQHREDEGGLNWLARFNLQSRNQMVVHCRQPDRETHPNAAAVLQSPLTYPLDQILTMYILADRRASMLHAAGLIGRQGAIALPGRSGAGKSTLSKLALDQLPFEVLSDDRVIVRGLEDGYRLFGTPWPGEAGIARQANAPLAALCFLKKADENQLTRLDAAGALDRLLPVTTIPWHEPTLFPAQLDFLGELARNVPCYELSFRNEPTGVEPLRELLA